MENEMAGMSPAMINMYFYIIEIHAGLTSNVLKI